MPASSSDGTNQAGDRTSARCDPLKGAVLFPEIISAMMLTSATSEGTRKVGFSLAFNQPLDAARAVNPANHQLLEAVASGDTLVLPDAAGIRLQ
jgi:hypothetical protein